MVRTITTRAELNAVIEGAGDKLIVLDFYADWCGPCRSMAPHFEGLSREFPAVVLVKVDSDRARELSGMFGVQGLPTFVFMRGERELDKLVGADPDKLRALTARHITPPPPPEPKSQWEAFPVSVPLLIKDNGNPAAASAHMLKHCPTMEQGDRERLALVAQQLAGGGCEAMAKQVGISVKPFVFYFSNAPSDVHFAGLDLLRLCLCHANAAAALAILNGTSLDVFKTMLEYAFHTDLSSKGLVNRCALAWECLCNALATEKSRDLVLPALLSRLASVTFAPGSDRLNVARVSTLFNVAVLAHQLRGQDAVDVCATACVAAAQAPVLNARLLGAVGTLYWTSYVMARKADSGWDVTSAMLLASLDLAPFRQQFAVVVGQLEQLFQLPLHSDRE